MHNLLVSIVIPYYNRKEKLNRALKSIFTQTYDNVEVLVVDDCSTIPPDFELFNFKYIKNSSNLGPGLSRNVGKNAAVGQYIIFLDSDDYLAPTFIEKCLETALILNNDFAFIYSKVGQVDEIEQFIRERVVNNCYPSLIMPHIFLDGRAWATSSCFWNKNVISDIEWADYRCWEDYLFDVQASFVNNKIGFINEILVYYDASGEDKLSKIAKGKQIDEKSRSLNTILEIFCNSVYIDDKKTKKKLERLFVKTIYELRNYSSLEKKIIMDRVTAIKKINFLRFLYLRILVKLPKKLSVILLDRYRKIILL